MNLIINTHSISQDKNGFFSLNDLHKASGNENRHTPALFLRNQQTQDLIQAIEKSGQVSYHTVKGNRKDGAKQGTFVCREIVIAYGMWINADFHLAVIRAFDALNTGAVPCLPKLSSEVLPAIRKMGYYKITPSSTPDRVVINQKIFPKQAKNACFFLLTKLI